MNEPNPQPYSNRTSNNLKNEEFEKQLKHITTIEPEYVDVDYYLTNVTKLLEKQNLNLNSRMFMDNIINTLDSINGGRKFNRALFTHILDFGSHKKDSVILL
jgi:hypothetical protein